VEDEAECLEVNGGMVEASVSADMAIGGLGMWMVMGQTAEGLYVADNTKIR